MQGYLAHNKQPTWECLGVPQPFPVETQAAERDRALLREAEGGLAAEQKTVLSLSIPLFLFLSLSLSLSLLISLALYLFLCLFLYLSLYLFLSFSIDI